MRLLYIIPFLCLTLLATGCSGDAALRTMQDLSQQAEQRLTQANENSARLQQALDQASRLAEQSANAEAIALVDAISGELSAARAALPAIASEASAMRESFDAAVEARASGDAWLDVGLGLLAGLVPATAAIVAAVRSSRGRKREQVEYLHVEELARDRAAHDRDLNDANNATQALTLATANNARIQTEQSLHEMSEKYKRGTGELIAVNTLLSVEKLNRQRAESAARGAIRLVDAYKPIVEQQSNEKTRKEIAERILDSDEIVAIEHHRNLTRRPSKA